MKSIVAKIIVASLTATLSLSALAAPGGGPGGPGHGGGPGGWGPGPAWGGAPARGHGLPDGARALWLGSMLYFLAAGTYYLWNADQQRYVPVAAPPVAQYENPNDYNVIAYPTQGQSPDQQARDRYECHAWAVSQSGFDPASAQQPPTSTVRDIYKRAIGACLGGRGYSIG